MDLEKKELFGIMINQINKTDLMWDLLRYAHRRDPSYLCAVNVHMLVESKRDQLLKIAVQTSTWAVTDGVPVKWAFNYFHKTDQPRLAGMDITPELLSNADQNGLVVSVFGNTIENLDGFKSHMERVYSNIKIGALISPPFREAKPDETSSYIEAINNVKTNILFVSLGCPKQEKWMLENYSDLHCVCLGVGNAINTVIGVERRPPKIIQKMGMEWMYRLLQNPKRLFMRYIDTNSRFAFMVIKRILTRLK
ncbi:MAG: WecB/TagA/CpsF family glycosyltransferase [Maribacter sp.]